MPQQRQRRTCLAVNTSGQPCRSYAVTGQDFCAVHLGKTKDQKAKMISYSGRVWWCRCDKVPGKHKLGVTPCTTARPVPTAAEQVAAAEKEKPPPVTVEDLAPFFDIEAPWDEFLAHCALQRGKLIPAAKAVGLAPIDVERRRKTDAHFSELFMLAQRFALDALIDALWDLSVGKHGAPDRQAAVALLSNLDPERFSADVRRVRHEGSVKHELDPTALRASIGELQATLQRRFDAREQRALEPPVLDAEVVEEVTIDEL